MTTVWGRTTALAVFVATLAAASGCASANGRRAVPPGTTQPDQFLYDRGKVALDNKKWLTAREFFKQVTETYTQSPVRPDAKLAIGDTYIGEGSSESLVLAIAEFQEFLSFYPTHPRADYAQYKLGLAHFRQMRAPQRDQSETRDTVREFELFLTRYPNSTYAPEVRNRLREAKDRLSEAEFEVGRFYFRIHWYPGAIDRLTALIKEDPTFTARDGVYFFLGESLIKVSRPAEALPLYEKLITEFDQSEYLVEAKKRLDELKNAPPAPPPGAPAPTKSTNN
ncbi:MAG: outer membrane protein assembly factor BamD [Vicinamibacterales bacterium]